MAKRCLLCYITDRTQFPGNEGARHRALLEKLAEAARAGVDYIQLREKDLTGRELEILAREALSVIRENSVLRTENGEPGTRLFINSRTDIALAVGADGVHLRGDDISPVDVRRIWSASAGGFYRGQPVIAISCHSQDEVARAESDGGDFAVFAPVFEKKGASPAGVAVLREVCQEKIPVLALGGVTVENARTCLEAGAAGIAGIRLFQENQVEAVVRALRG
jgi:thiamine-phosphate pyrophosphorylase